MKHFWLSLIAGTSMLPVLPAAEAVIENPYGVCAHVSRGEWQYAPQTFAKMKEAGISWVRTDFDWKNSEQKQGEWSFTHLDRLMELAAKERIDVLPILDYDVPWASPAWKHLDLWSAYVQKLVSRYPGQMYWEVWNEQNAKQFWRDNPSGANYATLLKRSYQEIKKINPKATVLYGGSAGVPLPFIEESLKAGAGEYFDAMNIHPYHWRGVPEAMFGDFAGLRQVMEKYGVGHKPVWITEVGWATARPSRFYADFLPVALKRAGINPGECTVAVVNDPELGFFESPNFLADFNLGMFRKVERIPLAALDRLDVKVFPVLMPTTSEEFPMAYLPQILDYLKRGGTLILPAGLPFYHNLKLDGKGSALKEQVGDRHMKALHLGWETWWTNKTVPAQEKWQRLAPEFAGQFAVPFRPSARFFTAANLKPGDEFIPIIEAGTEDYKGAVCALYKFNSDLKGNVIAYSGMGIIDSTTEERQAQMLPRTYIIALGSGVSRIFWYNFRAGEWEPDEREHHFGIVHKDLSPKPAYRAFRTLTAMLPGGSTAPAISQHGKIYLANWKRPDGKRVWAVWTAESICKVELKVTGEAEQIVNYMGEKVALPVSAGPSLVYLIGPEKINL